MILIPEPTAPGRKPGASVTNSARTAIYTRGKDALAVQKSINNRRRVTMVRRAKGRAQCRVITQAK